jgi:hypothetical protein
MGIMTLMVMNTRRAALLEFREAPQKLSIADELVWLKIVHLRGGPGFAEKMAGIGIRWGQTLRILPIADYRGVHFETYYGSQGVISLRQAHRVYVSPLCGIPH